MDRLTQDWLAERSATAAPPAVARFVSGLDLGPLSDYSALAVVEVAEVEKKVRNHCVRSLHRWPLRTPYGDIVADVAKAFAAPPLAGSQLVVDRTGVGVAVAETLRKARPRARIAQATIHGGSETGSAGGCWSVPKRELAGVLQVLLGHRRLTFAQGLPLADVLRKELESFTVKVNINPGAESFEAWREKDHDDIVLAVALACWFAERGQRRFCFFA